ncbi:MAG: SRPBCC family protein [Rhizobacter sp.]|nr:SRPBCC family protein [Chlorobiales bacterium]
MNHTKLSAKAFEVKGVIDTVFEVPVSAQRLMAYLSNPNTFEKNMPGVKAVSDKGDGRYEWKFSIDIPFAPPLVLSILTRLVKQDNEISFQTADSEGDTMACAMTLTETRNAKTEVRMKLSIKVRRKSGRDIHPLAPVMGERFVSEQMTQKMQSMANAFLKSSTKNLIAA